MTVRISLDCSDDSKNEYCRLYVIFGTRMFVFSGGSFLSDLYMAFMSAIELVNQAVNEVLIATDGVLLDFMEAWLEDHNIPKPADLCVETFLFIAQRNEHLIA